MPNAISQYLSTSRVNDPVIQAATPEESLKLFLNHHPKIANAIVFTGQHLNGAWPSWPDGLKKALADRWEDMVAWYGQGMPHPAPASFPDPLPREMAGDPDWWFGFVMSRERGRHVYLSHIANGLALEMTAKLPWSIAGYSAKHLEDLFSCTYWLEYLAPPTVTVEGYYIASVMSPTTPAHAMRFFTDNDLIGTDAKDTVARFFGWCKILIHYYGLGGAPDEHAFWGPDAPPIPASMLIKGSNFTGGSQPIFGHYTAACGGTAEFMKCVLRPLNIPVEMGTPPCGHVMALFPTINRAISHGDDPYDAIAWFTEFPGWPIPEWKEYLMTLDKYNEWFDPSLALDVMIKNVGRHVADLGIKYQSDWLLDRYCQDTAAGLDHASGQVFAYLSYFYTLEELEAKQLWENLEAKATAVNYCLTATPTLAPLRRPRVRTEPVPHRGRL